MKTRYEMIQFTFNKCALAKTNDCRYRYMTVKTGLIVDKFIYYGKLVVDVYKLIGRDERFDDWYIVQYLKVLPKWEEAEPYNIEGMKPYDGRLA